MKSSKELVEAFEANCRDLLRGRDSNPRFHLVPEKRAVFFEVKGAKGQVALDHLAEHAREMRWVAAQQMGPMLGETLERMAPDLYDASLDRKAERFDRLKQNDQTATPQAPRELPEGYEEFADQIRVGAPEVGDLGPTKSDDNRPIEVTTDAASAASEADARPDHPKKKRGRPRKPKP